MAIGASRGRVVAELMLEAVLVCAAAGFAGLLLATWTTRMFIALAPEGLTQALSPIYLPSIYCSSIYW